MILYLDTEFTELGPKCKLLSLGLVSEDGQHQFYGERNDVPAEDCRMWDVKTVVLPLFGRYPDCVSDLAVLGSRLREFLTGLPGPLIVACDYPLDFELLLQVLGDAGRHLVRGWRLSLDKEAQQAVWHMIREHHFETIPRHHALYDARVLRLCHAACKDMPREVVP